MTSEPDAGDELASRVQRICEASVREVFPDSLSPGDVICTHRLRRTSDHPAPEPGIGIVTDTRYSMDVVWVVVADGSRAAVPQVLIFDQSTKAMCDKPETVQVVGCVDLRAMGIAWVECSVEMEE